MKKPNIFAMAFLAGLLFYIALIWAIITAVLLTSCQPTLDPLREATFPCECIYKGYSHETHFQCQEELYKFKDENYYKTHNKGDVIKQPLK